MKTQKYEQIGCYFDGARGIYIGEEVQELAKEYGWKGQEVDSEHEDYHDTWTEAEDYLSEHLPIPPHTFLGSNENGDWGIWPIFPEDNDLPVFADYARDGKLCMPDDFTGEAYLVNDHGNITCGYWENGELETLFWDGVPQRVYV